MNDLRYTPDGGRFEVVLSRQADNQARVRVEDSGAGIAREHLPGLLDRSSPLRTAPRKHAGGGLGLLISKRILELHGSTIEAVSAQGLGAMFTFCLPTTTPA